MAKSEDAASDFRPVLLLTGPSAFIIKGFWNGSRAHRQLTQSFSKVET